MAAHARILFLQSPLVVPGYMLGSDPRAAHLKWRARGSSRTSPRGSVATQPCINIQRNNPVNPEVEAGERGNAHTRPAYVHGGRKKQTTHTGNDRAPHDDRVPYCEIKQRNTTADEGGEGPTEARQSNSESTSQTEMHAEGTHGIRGHRQVRSVDGFDPTRFCRY